jgi:hypothetical protein
MAFRRIDMSIRASYLALILLLFAASGILADPDWGTFEIQAEVSDSNYPGEIAPMSIDLIRCDQEFGGFDLLLSFDPSVLDVDHVDPGQLITDCAWEYFEYRSDLGPGLLRIVAIADVANGPIHPLCYSLIGSVATVYFQVDAFAPTGMHYPVRFIWIDCADNVLSSVMGDSLFVSDDVYDWDGSLLTGQPDIGGIDLDCLTDLPPDALLAQWVEFTSGAIEVVIPPVPKRCDPNNNLVPYEIDDMVFLINYLFLNGPAPDPYDIGDCDCNGTVNFLDVTRSIAFIFRGAPDPCEEP